MSGLPLVFGTVVLGAVASGLRGSAASGRSLTGKYKGLLDSKVTG